MKKMKRKLKLKKQNPIFLLGSILVVFLLSISVGFSALSTSLSVNGTAAFTPVGMIRVMSIAQDTLISATETNKSITPQTEKDKRGCRMPDERENILSEIDRVNAMLFRNEQLFDIARQVFICHIVEFFVNIKINFY